MATSITVRAIAAASKAVAELGLKQAGFRRMGNHLNRSRENLVHAIHFQGSQWGSAASGSFTVNLVVTSPFLYSTWTGRPFPANPASALFAVTSRIGRLMPSRADHWWQVEEETDLAALANETASAIVEYGLPFFDEFDTVQSILTRLRHGDPLPGLTDAQLPLVHAMLSIQAGAREEGQGLLERAYSAAGSSAFRGTVRMIADRLGVPVL